jgi:hypothetical protein
MAYKRGVRMFGEYRVCPMTPRMRGPAWVPPKQASNTPFA